MGSTISDRASAFNEAGYDIRQAPGHAYVYLRASDAWTPVGLLRQLGDRHATTWEFRYGRRWRSRPDAFPLDPVNLPLSADPVTSRSVPGAIQDAAPDRWGMRLTDLRFRRMLDAAIRAEAPQGANDAPPPRMRMMTTLDVLLLGSDDRVGALAFGTGLDGPLLRVPGASLHDLAYLEAAMVAFDAGQPVSDEFRLMGAGTSLGGARPKATVRLPDGGLWLAKFRRRDDTIDVVRCEHAAMTLAAAAGATIAETRVLSLGNREALLVRRFDREAAEDGERRLPYLSGLSLLGLQETDLGGSYPEIADRMRRAGCPPGDLVELFRRMVINVGLGNQDDHLRNHGLLMRDGRWTLSPGFDVAPTPDGSGFQAIGVGVMGPDATLRNALSQCGRFGLDLDAATTLARQAGEVLGGWREHFAAYGVSERDLATLARGMVDVTPQVAAPKP
jgi:serine/threonine-protein kinase HipA